MADTQEQAPAPAADQEGAAAPPAENAAPAPEMRCINLVGFGGIRMVKVQKKVEVKPAEGEVLIRVKAWWVEVICICFIVTYKILKIICYYLFYCMCE